MLFLLPLGADETARSIGHYSTLLPQHANTELGVHELSPYAFNQSQQLLGDIRSLFFSVNNVTGEPPSPPLYFLREVEWISMVSSAGAFLFFMLVAWGCKRLLDDPRARERTVWYVQCMRAYVFERKEQLSDAVLDSSEEQTPQTIWNSVLHFLFCTSGIIGCYVVYAVYQVCMPSTFALL